MTQLAPDGGLVDARESAPLPGWPLALLFWLMPLWWLSGLIDVIWIPVAIAMVLLLISRGNVAVPRGFGLWLLFLGLMLASFLMLPREGGSPVVFAHRAALYLSATVLFVYIYNGPQSLRERLVPSCLIAYWLTTIAGGFLGVLAPDGALRTPLYHLLSAVAPGALGNELLNQMAIRRFAQVSENSYFGVPARPSAPFLYTNNWGNVYSMLLPVVVAYLVTAKRRGPAWWALAVIVPVSTIPAFLTVNRGMFIGLTLGAVIIGIRLILQRNVKGVSFLGGLAVFAAIAFMLLPVQERLETRLQGNGTETRASVYSQALDLVPGSPFFGYGVPVPSEIPNEPAVGTQGHFWMLLVSHGAIATFAFMAFFLWMALRTRRRRDPVGLTLNSLLVVAMVEMLYYGLLPYGLPVLMCAAAVLAGSRSRY
ncbi:MAG TPA: O-antigen ligase family protein [Nocardioidaceae bacterium]|nr:O-antigen ligase family protein [Nocardioidaceae bacterium]